MPSRYFRWTPRMFARLCLLKARGLQRSQIVQTMLQRYPGASHHTVKNYLRKFVGPVGSREQARTAFERWTGSRLTPEQFSELQRGKSRAFFAEATPERKSEMARLANAALTPEQRSERSKRANARLTPEQRSDAKRKAWQSMTPEQKATRAKAISRALTPEQRREIALRREAAKTPEERRRISRKSAEGMSRDQRTARAKQGYAASLGALTLEGRRAMSQANWTRLSPEERSA